MEGKQIKQLTNMISENPLPKDSDSVHFSDSEYIEGREPHTSPESNETL